jgi:hypothetical protein
LPRQSGSSAILASISSEGDLHVCDPPFFFMRAFSYWVQSIQVPPCVVSRRPAADSFKIVMEQFFM